MPRKPKKQPQLRIRDFKKFFKPQEVVPAAVWEQIEDRAARAAAFFSDDNPLYSMMQADLKECEDMIYENRIREVREEHTVASEDHQVGVLATLKKTFITPKKIQDDEVVGQIKYIRGYFKELQSWIDLKKQREAEEGAGRIQIERSKK